MRKTGEISFKRVRPRVSRIAFAQTKSMLPTAKVAVEVLSATTGNVRSRSVTPLLFPQH